MSENSVKKWNKKQEGESGGRENRMRKWREKVVSKMKGESKAFEWK